MLDYVRVINFRIVIIIKTVEFFFNYTHLFWRFSFYSDGVYTGTSKCHKEVP